MLSPSTTNAGPVAETDRRPRICVAITDALERLGVSQQALADALDVNQSSVAKWCSFREPRLDRIATIEDALGMPRGQLLRDAGYVGPWEPR